VRADGTARTFRVRGGFLQVVHDVVRVVAERANAE
jgi:F0F1-type ATP synthase epsilon subunit